MTKLSPQAAKMLDLSKAMAKRGEQAVTIYAGTPEWAQWKFWRRTNGLGYTFMESQGRWGVPSIYPPATGLDTALAEYQAGTRRKLET